MKVFFQRILQEIMKKIILGTSDTWSMSHLSWRTKEPAYYNGDCQIFTCLLWLYRIRSAHWFSDRLNYISKALLCWLSSVCSDRLVKFLTFRIHILRFSNPHLVFNNNLELCTTFQIDFVNLTHLNSNWTQSCIWIFTD